VGELMPFPRPSEGPVLVAPPAPGWLRSARTAGWRVRRSPLPPHPWRQVGTLVVASGTWSAGAIVLALSRGAGVAIEGPDDDAAAGRDDPAEGDRWADVLDDLGRVGGRVWPRPAPDSWLPAGLDATTGTLLDALARGRFVGEAARSAHVSLRTAHRRLRVARDALGAATTAEAVARWSRRTDGPGSGRAPAAAGAGAGGRARPEAGAGSTAAGEPDAGRAVVPAHESAVRRLAADAAGRPYRALRTLVEAQAADDGVVVLEGDLGGQIYAVFPSSVVRCSEQVLRELVRDLDAHARPFPDGDATDVYFERHRLGEAIAGGAGGGVVLPGGWVQDELVQAGIEAAIVDVVMGRRARLGPA